MSGLPTLAPGFSLIALGETASTNEHAKRLALENDGADGTVVWARRQTAGRGREARRWISDDGNLFCSILMRPRIAAKEAGQVGFLAGLAAFDAVAGAIGGAPGLRLKWPNDLLAKGKKLGGILIEASTTGSGRIDWLVCGVGINLAHHPDETEFPATSLSATFGGRPRVEDMLEAYVGQFKAWRDRWLAAGFQPLRDAWLDRAAGLGEMVSVRLGGTRVEGRFLGLAEDGALLMEAGQGTRRITVGDVFFAEHAAG